MQDMTQALYEEKDQSYFDNARADFIDLLPIGRQDVLEIGCGTGSTAISAYNSGCLGRYLGIELNHAPAEIARLRGLDVITANIEQFDLSSYHQSFDVLWASEVLEHLTDPWTVIAKLVKCIRPGGQIVVSTPNVAHRSVILGLIRNKFDYTDSGVMDRSHLRWFTPKSLADLVQDAGTIIRQVMPSRSLNKKASVFNLLTGGKLQHLLHTQTIVVGQKA